MEAQPPLEWLGEDLSRARVAKLAISLVVFSMPSAVAKSYRFASDLIDATG
jgi:hypothetical protein